MKFKESIDQKFPFLTGGGEMGALTRTKDWSKTSVGRIDTWPQSLRTTLSIILNSRFPMFLWWGDDLIQFYNDAYRPSFGNTGKHPAALGQKARECWPEIWEVIKPLIDQVLAGGEATWSEDQYIPIYRNGKLEDVYWTFSYSPVKNETGNVQGVLVVCNETTTQVTNLKNIVHDITAQKAAYAHIEDNSSKFRNTVRQAPVAMCIFRGPEYIIEMANDKMLELWNKTSGQVLNKKIFEGVPEATGQGFEQILHNVYTKGERYFANEMPISLSRKNGTQIVYVNFTYEPLREEDGSITGITAVATDVTPQVDARHALQESEKQFRNLIMPSPIAMAIFRGKDMIVEIANHAMLKIWQREGQYVKGKKYLELLPEMSNQKFSFLMEEVYRTGQSYQENENLALVNRGNEQIRFYLNYLLAPLFETDGKTVSGLMVTINDVTEMVEARKQLLDSSDRLMLATEGTRLATWDLDLNTNHLIHSPRMAVLFGHPEGTQLKREETRQQIHPDDATIIKKDFEDALKTGVNSYEARVIHPDKTIHWIKTEGKVIFDEHRVAQRMIGTMRDITNEKIAEEKMSQLAAIVHSSHDAIISKTLGGIITSWNDGAQRVFGYTPEEIIGQHISKLIPPDRLEEEPLIISRLRLGEHVDHFETERLTKDGRKIEISLTISPIRNSKGTIIGASKIARNISEQKRAERTISESEERLKIVVDASELGTWELNLVTHEFIYSPRYSAILGYGERTDVSHAEFLRHMHPDDLPKREKAFQEAFKTGVLHYTSRLIWDDGSVHWIEGKGKVFYDHEHKPFKMVGTARDLTEEKSYQQKIEESEQRFRVVADTAPVLIWMAGTDGQCHYFNIKWLAFTGRTLEQERGTGWTQGIHPDDKQRCLEIYLNATRNREDFNLEFRLRRFDGEYRWISSNGSQRFTSDGMFEGYIGACMDIHDRIVFEEKLKESESRLRIAAMSSELGTWDYTPATQKLTWDNPTRELYGVDADTPITLELFWSKIHPEDRDWVMQKLVRSLNPEEGDPYDAEYRLVNLPGNVTRWIHAKGKAFFDENRNPYLFSGTVLDITEKQLALQELQSSEKKFRLLADSMPQFIWTGDEGGNLNYFNQSVYNYSGLSQEQIEKEGWLQIVHPEDQEVNIRLWTESINSGKNFIFEHRFRKYTGEYRWQLSRAIPQVDKEGNILMWVGTSTDIHDQKLMTNELEKRVAMRTQELKQTNDELARSNTELASFSYVASHDLQEPLRKIQTFATRLLENEKDKLSDTGKDYFGRMQSASARMQTLINDLLTYSRINTNEKQLNYTDLNLILQDVKNDLRETIEERNAIIESTDLPSMKVIMFQFRQLLTNLIGNSLKFSKPDLPPVIRLTAEKINGSAIKEHTAQPDIHYIKFVLTDNGIGFDEKYSELIFQVFQRLHGRNEYTGTGIGLSICKKIIENHHGFISVKSESGKGAAFTFYLPQ